MDLNKVTLIGNLTRDPEEQKDDDGPPAVAFTLATNRAWKDAKTRELREEVDFHRVVAEGKLGEIVSKYLRRGHKVYVEGRLTNRFRAGGPGRRLIQAEIIADNLIILSRGHGENGQAAA